MEEKHWIIEYIPDNLRKREYLYYLLETRGFRLTPSCRDSRQLEEYKGIISISRYSVDNLRIDISIRETIHYTVLTYEEAIQLLEQDLKITKNEKGMGDN